MREIGQRIHERAQALGLSDSELARKLGLSQSRVANYIVGKRAPDYGTLLRICDVLGVTPNDLLGVGQPPDPMTETERLRARIALAVSGMNKRQLTMCLKLVDAVAEDFGE